ncbi:MAG TPA: hypothetical protein ENO07_04975, partial [candidate division Zixibacteria bacterium]|nr:hypothetical protein [candidate division Zixibacteria bacterium]
MAENKLKLIHFADLHARRDNLDKVEKFFEFALQVAEDKEPDIVVIPGDIWDGEVAVNENSPLYMVIRYIRRLAMLQDVYMIPGTPSHDRPGSLNIFKSLHTERQIFVLDRPELFSMCIDIKRKERGNLAVFPIPGVTKSGLMTWAKSRGLDLSPDRADVEAAGLVRELFLGFRAEMARFATRHPEFIPLLLGHFTVYGSETPTGQVMTGGDIVISTTDIREAGAVINCLGHIHKPQQIGENIFYSGSPFPHNWGEKEQKSVLYAEVNRHEILQLERIPTPFPAMVDFDLIYYPEDSDDQPFRFLDKKTGGPAGFPDFNPHGCNQADTRIRLHMPPEAKDLVNEDHIKKWLSWNDLHPNSVKFEKIIKPQSRQRCEVINEAITNLERLKAWAETTETDLAEDIPAKLHKLQSELVLEDDAGLTARGTIRLKSLRLRGSKGITWTDEIKIDFEKFNSDMILFDGDNGAGKSTTFDNLHPYPFSFYYDGLNWNAKLSDHFRLEDSCRELVVSIDGIDYMFLLVVDGVRGKAEYYAYRLDGEDWTTLNDGKKPSYKRVVLELFGSPELFQQGVYQVQGTNGLINKTNAELKDMFYDFLGFTEYQAIAEKAKESAQALQNEISLTEAKLSEDRRALEFIPEFDAELEKQQKAIAEHKANKFLATSELEELEFKLKEREKKAATQESVKKQIADLDQQLEELSTR